MLIIDALKALYKKTTTKDAAATSIAGVVQEMADNWPAAGGAGAATTENLLQKFHVYTPFQLDFAYKRAATPRTAYPAFKARQARAILYQKSACPL